MIKEESESLESTLLPLRSWSWNQSPKVGILLNSNLYQRRRKHNVFSNDQDRADDEIAPSGGIKLLFLEKSSFRVIIVISLCL